jgi:archaellin
MAAIIRIILRVITDERGFTGLDTAGILASLVIAGSAVSAVILSSGIEAADQFRTVFADGMARVTTNVQLRGTVIATSGERTSNAIIFDLVTAPGSRAIAINPEDPANALIINYVDSRARVAAVPYSVKWPARGDGDALLEPGESVEVTLPLPAGAEPPCPCAPGPNESFTLEMVVPAGGVTVLERTLPPFLRPVMNLH